MTRYRYTIPGADGNRRSKYGNVKTNGSDSKREDKRKEQLLLMLRAGHISDLQFQVPFELIPAQYEPDMVGKRGGVKRGKCVERACRYIADFVYTQDGKKIVEDTKGFRTPDYIIKRKLMLWRYGIRIKEI